ncbi:MAG: hypothetical protein NZ529_06750 [Cytophagaceae bacterium]|nr:hypothetical protein [Cytophagaceae bacterium]MDW8456479.1 hypothetical protein [Cytophagaceae bacterium]
MNLAIENKKSEIRNRQKAAAISLAVHAILFIIIFFFIAWKDPVPPPPPPPGIEIGIAFEATSGSKPSVTENINTEPEVSMPEEVEKTAEFREQVITTPLESPDVLKKDEEKKEEKKEQKVDEKNKFPAKRETEKKSEEINKDNLYNPDGKGESNNKTKGQSSGEGGGFSMDTPGWIFDTRPDKQDPTSKFGYVEFEFLINEEGEIIPGSVKMTEVRNFTPTEYNFYKKQLLETTFSPIDPKMKMPPRTKGRYSFEVKSR